MKPLVYQTAFGLADGAVSVMYGVALKECPDLKIYDLTHEIEPYNVTRSININSIDLVFY